MRRHHVMAKCTDVILTSHAHDVPQVVTNCTQFIALCTNTAESVSEITREHLVRRLVDGCRWDQDSELLRHTCHIMRNISRHDMYRTILFEHDLLQRLTCLRAEGGVQEETY